MWQQALLLALQEPSFVTDKMKWGRQSLRHRICLSYVLSSLMNSGYFDDSVTKEREVELGLAGKSWILRTIFAMEGKAPVEVQAASRTAWLEQSREVRRGHTKGTQRVREGRGEKCMSGTRMCHIKQSETEPCIYTVGPYTTEFNCPFQRPHRHSQTCVKLISVVFLNAVKLTMDSNRHAHF